MLPFFIIFWLGLVVAVVSLIFFIIKKFIIVDELKYFRLKVLVMAIVFFIPFYEEFYRYAFFKFACDEYTGFLIFEPVEVAGFEVDNFPKYSLVWKKRFEYIEFDRKSRRDHSVLKYRILLSSFPDERCYFFNEMFPKNSFNKNDEGMEQCLALEEVESYQSRYKYYSNFGRYKVRLATRFGFEIEVFDYVVIDKHEDRVIGQYRIGEIPRSDFLREILPTFSDYKCDKEFKTRSYLEVLISKN